MDTVQIEADCNVSLSEHSKGEHTVYLALSQIILLPLKITCGTRFCSTDVIVQTTNNIT